LVRQYLTQIAATPLLSAADEVDLAKQIEAGVYAAELLHRHNAGAQTLPVPDRRDELEAIVRDGQQAKDRMIRANLRLVVSAAKKYIHRGLPFLDVIQEGNLGLIRAVEKFDHTKGYKFTTYAMWWIRQAIQRGIADHARTIRLPAYTVEQLTKLARTERQLGLRLGREPTEEELANEARISIEKIVELRGLVRDVVSLETPVGEDTRTRVGDLIEDTEILQASDVVEYAAFARELRAALDTLSPREAIVISLRYGLHNGHPYSTQEVAKRLGLTGARVQQLEHEALLKLRTPERSDPLLDWAS
jgi:RNA polymerase sigma factor (sigma-70 family)